MKERFDLRLESRLAGSRYARKNIDDIGGWLCGRTKRFKACLCEGRSGSLRADVDRVGRAGAGAREDDARFIHKDAFGFGAAAIKTKDTAHGKRIRENRRKPMACNSLESIGMQEVLRR